ncbi:MAG: SUMF1/EgtB/PvdO family nonheme iron enzyme [Gammaproteobacteria bacterium]|nr:SUMF1/EgtB/PvdO family nonheme iron enzyme [Gammaproteobacteria bacterium]MDE0252649.1 SUMF1/EgtB/PvdO family nonheme iron enzyme [Gammaproteobacteria bacterium]MDE0403593.1 SUMF1/EgtB/PvdO family nonheme iron enzyme [Gammaproteobacteria bacterium]
MQGSNSSKRKPSDIEELISVQKVRRTRVIVIVSVLLPLFLLVTLLFSMKVVSIEVPDPRAENQVQLTPTQGFGIALNERIMFWGEVQIEVQAEGFYPDTTGINRTTSSPLEIALEPLPGKVKFRLAQELSGESSEFKVVVNDQDTFDPLPQQVQLPKGSHSLRILGPNGYDLQTELQVIGYAEEQWVQVESLERGTLKVQVIPENAIIELSGSILAEGSYSGPVSIGEYELVIHAEKFVDHKVPISIIKGATVDLKTINLRRLPGIVRLSSEPDEASLLINGGFIGTTPKVLTIHEESFELTVRKPGYQSITETIVVASRQDERHHYVLEPLTYEVSVESDPVAEITLNQENKGESPVTITAKAGDILEVSQDGYASQQVTLQSESSQVKELKFKLVELAINAFEQAAETIVVSESIRLKKFSPMKLQVAIPKELLTDESVNSIVEITKPFYMGTHEIRRKEYAKFDTNITVTPENENLPVTGIPWIEAIKFCNWLSQKEGLENVYTIKASNQVEINTNAGGFRLPTEAEWEAVAQFNFQKRQVIGKYTWGTIDKPPTGVGNLAGFETREALQLYIESYTDDHVELAPVGSYSANLNGIYDLEGNAAEWIWDFYSHPLSGRNESLVDPLGPSDGLDHIIKGGSFRSTMLSDVLVNARRVISFEDETVGFRVARWIF